MTADDIATVLSAVGDSWPAAVVLVAGVGGFVAIRALPRLKEIVEAVQALRHEMEPNSGKSLRDAIDRIEQTLAGHIAEDTAWKAAIEEQLP